MKETSMTWYLWISFVTISTVNIVTPGPAILNTIRRSTQFGFGKIQPTILGNAFGLGCAGFIVASGVAHFILESKYLLALVSWLGIAYLAWLGLNFILRTEEIVLRSEAEISVLKRSLFLEAFFLALTNPKAILFYIALFPQVMNKDFPLVPQMSVLVLTYCFISIISLNSYSLLASILRDRFITQKRYTLFRICSGFILLIFAGKLALDIL